MTDDTDNQDNESVSAPAAVGVNDPSLVWEEFAQSVKYLADVAAIYRQQQQNQRPEHPPTSEFMTTTKAHVKQAIELLATNVVNASVVIATTLDRQDQQCHDLTTQLQRMIDESTKK